MITRLIEQVIMMNNASVPPNPGKASDVDILLRRVNHLTDTFDFWNRWMLWGLAFAALAATWIGVTTCLTIVRSKQLSVAQGNLDTAKEGQLTLELKDKDRQIANVKSESDNKVAGLQARAKEAEAGVESARADAGRANARAAEANKAAETEKIERLKLEGLISPRRLTHSQAKNMAEELSLFTGRKVEITSYSADIEGRLLGTQLLNVVHAANLSFQDSRSIFIPLGRFNTGIVICGSDEKLLKFLFMFLSASGLAVSKPMFTEAGKPNEASVSGWGDAQILVGIKPLE